MDDLEKILLEKGITKESLEKMQKIEHELLKLEKASFDKNKDKKRKSRTNINTGDYHKVKPIDIDTRVLTVGFDELNFPLHQNKIFLYLLV